MDCPAQDRLEGRAASWTRWFLLLPAALFTGAIAVFGVLSAVPPIAVGLILCAGFLLLAIAWDLRDWSARLDD